MSLLHAGWRGCASARPWCTAETWGLTRCRPGPWAAGGALALLVTLLACAAGQPTPGPAPRGQAEPQRGRPLAVVASFYPLAEFARRVGGERVTVSNLTPPGVEPHDLELTPRDVERLRTAALIVHNGLGFQPALDKTLASVVDPRRTRVVDATAGIELLAAEGAEKGEAGGKDRHVWLDPLLAQRQASAIQQALAAIDAGGTAEYAARGQTLQAELEGLDRRYIAGLERCERREVVTMHTAFGYLARRYGLRQMALAGQSPEGEPSPQQVRAVLGFIREQQVRAIFVEPLASARAAETLAREAKVEVLRLNPIESLTREEEARGETYFSVMEANLAALRRGLGCRW